jgi:hypothetical protein
VSGRTRAILIGLGAVAAIALAAVLVWRVALRERAEPVSVAEAVTRFRAEARAADTTIPAGVYLYETSGWESISALGGRRHRYPRRSSLTVTSDGCGMSLRWDALRSRHSTWRVCTGGGGLRLVSWEEAHNFVGRDDVTRWRCTATAWLPADSTPGSSSEHACTGGDTEQRGLVTVLGEETLVVGDVPVETVRLRVGVEETGEARGPLVEERWLEPVTGLPVRISYRVTTTNDSPIGDVTFDERYDLRLLSLQPRR